MCCYLFKIFQVNLCWPSGIQSVTYRVDTPCINKIVGILKIKLAMVKKIINIPQGTSRNLKKGTERNRKKQKLTKKFSKIAQLQAHYSQFLEALLVQQAHSELKNCVLKTGFDLFRQNCKVRTFTIEPVLMWKRPTFAVLTKYCQHFYAFDGVAVGQDVTWPSNL